MIKGIDLIEKIIEFIEMIPDKELWNYKSLENNESALLRLKQIDILIGAFGLRKQNAVISLRDEIAQVLNGNFYENLDWEISNQTTEFVHQFILDKMLDKEYIEPLRRHEILFIFPKMLNYKIQITKLLKFNSGWLECSPRFNLAYFHINMVDEINAKFADKYQILDDIIELIVNPKNQTFIEADLVEQFNYVSDDEIQKSDFENW
ncbi:hypothetical protein [Chryseobacterium caseinilyticum]|uniref:Uncharacterized protein n=1 Tax=Chryseobacterium caseinilyticum TaxID=2771428 RepID=A0ABR8ZD65_9FLAO|nr:hypothetical protein [Chryseobacterium caseinilyticum]MBD8083243.1 hypothetical protein [Chryseobacterium caseinilyticum]